MLRELFRDRMWVAGMPLRFYGIEVGTRMSACRLSDGGLLLHSPLKLDEELRGALEGLGPVRFVVSPNKLHHLFLGDYSAAYPEAGVFASPGLPEKRPDLTFHGVLGEVPEPGWAEDLDQMVFRGNRYLDEVVIFQRESRTLLLADLIQSFHPEDRALTRLIGRMYGTYENPGSPPALKLTFGEKAAAGASLERVLSWDFDRIVIAHGRVIETGGKEVLRRAYSFLY